MINDPKLRSFFCACSLNLQKVGKLVKKLKFPFIYEYELFSAFEALMYEKAQMSIKRIKSPNLCTFAYFWGIIEIDLKVGEFMKKDIFITTPYITLGQLLKEENIVESGGKAKWYLKENMVYLNDEPENRRGKKLYKGDTVSIPDVGMFFIKTK